MKLKYMFMLAVSALFMVGCSTDNDVAGTFGLLSDTYVIIPAEGGSKTVNINASSDWQFVGLTDKNGKQQSYTVKTKNGVKDTTYTDLWFTLSQLTGTAGQTQLTVSADACDYGRETELKFAFGNGTSQFLMVRQGDIEAQTATCAEVIAGADGKTFRVKGTCTAIANTTYGNWYMNDGTGEIYIYGTLNKDGEAKKFTDLGIEEGDVVTVEGPKTTYGSTIELVNVTVIKIEKSLVKVISERDTLSKEGGELAVKVAYKGSGVYPTINSDWLTYKSTEQINGIPSKIEANPADTAIIKFDVQPNAGGSREGSVTFTSANSDGSSSVEYTFLQEGGIVECSIADFLAAEEGATLYRLTGVISSVKNDQYGNFYLKDYSGETYIYGMGTKGDFAAKGLKVGDIVTVLGVRSSYNGTPQSKNVTLEDSKSVTTISVADFKNLSDDKTTYYKLTGTIAKSEEANTKFDLTNYGNFALNDATGSVYVYGLATGWGGPIKQAGALNLSEGDNITIIGYKTSYKGLNQVGGAFLFSKE